MNKRILVILLVNTFSSVHAQDIQWIKGTEINLGQLEAYQDTTFQYTFLNTSDKSIAIETVRTTCGCTNPQWPTELIAPGEKGQIQVTFTPKRSGFHRKKLKVFIVGARKGHTLWLEGDAR